MELLQRENRACLSQIKFLGGKLAEERKRKVKVCVLRLFIAAEFTYLVVNRQNLLKQGYLLAKSEEASNAVSNEEVQADEILTAVSGTSIKSRSRKVTLQTTLQMCDTGW